MKFKLAAIVLLVLLSQSCSMEKLYKMKQNRKVYPLEQIDFNSLVKRYFAKEKPSVGTIEGIYSVSSLVSKKGKGLLSANEKEKITDRKENYAKVAVIQDKENPNREYFEVSLEDDHLPSYSIIGEFTGLTDANILVYKHLESRGRSESYTFTYDKSRDMLEGIRTENDGSFTITYKLTYLKLFPKAEDQKRNQ